MSEVLKVKEFLYWKTESLFFLRYSCKLPLEQLRQCQEAWSHQGFGRQHCACEDQMAHLLDQISLHQTF